MYGFIEVWNTFSRVYDQGNIRNEPRPKNSEKKKKLIKSIHLKKKSLEQKLWFLTGVWYIIAQDNNNKLFSLQLWNFELIREQRLLTIAISPVSMIHLFFWTTHFFFQVSFQDKPKLSKSLHTKVINSDAQEVSKMSKAIRWAWGKPED